MTDSGNHTEDQTGTDDISVPGIVRNFGDSEPLISGMPGSELGGAVGVSSGSRGSKPERAAVVTARGTADGLILRVESSVSRESLRKGLWDFMESRRNFICGNELIIEWTDEKPEDPFVAELQQELTREFEVIFKDFDPETRPGLSFGGPKVKAPSLFDGIEALGINPGGITSASAGLDRVRPTRGEGMEQGRKAQPAAVWDEPDARIVYGTLRSGQKVETEHSIVVVGDVNSGAEIVAGGDVVVLGCLRGIAHAGAYDETGGGRTIFALNLQPTQLRIGGVITRGTSNEGYAGPELARVDGAMIIVEAYQSRGMVGGKGGTNKR
jgi:septum site-determining protein MinC